jgi:two-component system sensor histidine kinase HydH
MASASAEAYMIRMLLKRITSSRWARWGWLLTTFVLGAALLTSEWLHYRRTAGAILTLGRGQGEDLLEHARQRLRDRPLDALPVDSFFAAYQESGLRYIGIYGEGDRVLAEAGEAIGPRTARMIGGSDVIVDLGGRYRHFGTLPVAPPRPGTPEPSGSRQGDSGVVPGPSTRPVTGGARRPPPDEGAGGMRREGERAGRGPGPSPQDSLGRPRRPPAIIIEYEPLLALQIAADSRRAFALAAIVTGVLLAVAFGYWRLSVRHEAAQLRMDQQKRLGMLGEMSAVLAHEIRNPLASLKGNAQLLAERLPGDGAERRKADRIVTEAQRLEALTADLLDFSRSGPIDVQPANPVAVLEASVQDVDPDGITVDTTRSPDAWPLDARRMQQALTNLLRNARQATADGTRAEAAITQENGALVFTVRDHGAGIPAGQEKLIFSPFYTTRTTGTGLGLAVAQRVAEMHHGSITAANHPQGGAVFRIAIPKS